MNRSTILSTPGPVTGSSTRAGILWSGIALITYLMALYLLMVWHSWSVLILVLLGPFITMLPACIQAAHNGSVVLSLLITIAPVVGMSTSAYLRSGDLGEPGIFILMALFAGATAHLLGFETSNPRPASERETRAVTGILVVSGAVFVYEQFPGFHEVVVAGFLVVTVTGFVWLARDAVS